MSCTGSVLDYVQEIGRCARDGTQGEAIMYKAPYTVRKDRVDVDMMAIVKNVDTCMRLLCLRKLKLSLFDESDLAKCCKGPRCCYLCDR